jgi:predicted nucleic acid-binding protein
MTTATIPSGSELWVVDSSGWLEYITEDTKAADFAPYIEGTKPILVPTIVVFEVYKKLRADRGKTVADRFYSQALQRTVVPLDEHLAVAAAAMDHRLPMADAIIYATAQAFQAQLITSDTHFQGLPGVTLI